jgi:hypothetical protein
LDFWAAVLKPQKVGGRKEGEMSRAKSTKTVSQQHIPKLNSVEVALISPLVQNISFDHEIVEECVKRGFIPRCLAEPLIVVKFLSRTILAAQSAQREYRIPASFLIGLAIYESGWDAETLAKNVEGDDATEFTSCSLDVQRWFLEVARVLAESPKYAKALPLADVDVKAYGMKLAALGFRDSLDMEDILTPIENYNLQQCDLAALRSPNEYTQELFTQFRDEHGSRKLRAAWLDLVPIMRRDAALPARAAS